MIADLESIGGPHSPVAPVGWAPAMNTPYQWTKPRRPRDRAGEPAADGAPRPGGGADVGVDLGTLVRPAQQVARELATASASVREVLGLAGGHPAIAARSRRRAPRAAGCSRPAHGVGAELRIAVETADRAMLVPLVLTGVGAALPPRSMASDAAAKGAVIRQASPALPVQARSTWRRRPLSPAAASFVVQAPPRSPTRG